MPEYRLLISFTHPSGDKGTPHVSRKQQIFFAKDDNDAEDKARQALMDCVAVKFERLEPLPVVMPIQCNK